MRRAWAKQSRRLPPRPRLMGSPCKRGRVKLAAGRGALLHLRGGWQGEWVSKG